MIPPLSGAGAEAVDRALELLRISLLAAAATRRPAAGSPREHCRSTGTPRHPRGTGTAA
ncbi:hypothetical protein [Cryptosporangium sp. NPDC051539]|uniref:hypothetical protein n=1 Tax=Cryptosporangium sp. NPDC051539 TaxID=3363962 RepID=UPI0037AB8EC4